MQRSHAVMHDVLLSLCAVGYVPDGQCRCLDNRLVVCWKTELPPSHLSLFSPSTAKPCCTGLTYFFGAGGRTNGWPHPCSRVPAAASLLVRTHNNNTMHNAPKPRRRRVCCTAIAWLLLEPIGLPMLRTNLHHWTRIEALHAIVRRLKAEAGWRVPHGRHCCTGRMTAHVWCVHVRMGQGALGARQPV